MAKFLFNEFLGWLKRVFGVFLTPTHTEEWTNPATADVDAIVVTFATSTAIQVLSGSDLDGTVGTGQLDPPRNLTATLNSNADWDTTTMTIAGTDVNGDSISEDFDISNGGNETLTGAKAFAYVTSVTVPAQSGTNGTMTVGFGALIGFAKPAKTRVGVSYVLQELEAGTYVATGTFAAKATGAPNGTYAPNNAPNATRDYAVTYELDSTAWT